MNAIDVIGIIANNPRHAGLPDLFQLAQGERALLAQAEVVEELVALLQPRKLVPDDALEHWAEDGVFVRCLEETAQIKIDVIHRFVDAPSKEQMRTFSFFNGVCASPHLLNVPRLDAFPEVCPVLGLAPRADLAVLVVAGQPVVSTSLDVHRHKVKTSPKS